LSPFAVSKIKALTSTKQAAKYKLVSYWFLAWLILECHNLEYSTAVRNFNPILTAGYPLLAVSVYKLFKSTETTLFHWQGGQLVPHISAVQMHGETRTDQIAH
jgi:hypothetical protein